VSPDPQIEAALAELRAGRPIVIPTDTVYGVAALPSVAAAIEAVFWAKDRPKEKALPILAAEVAALEEVVVLDDRARAVADRFWPGPLTLVLERAPQFHYDLGGGTSPMIAVRIPEHPLTLELLRASGPLAVTSANRSGDEPALTVEEAREALGDVIDVYVDGGPCEGSPSTIVSLAAGFEVLRRGGLDPDEVLAAIQSSTS
jgi:tRNA threonylcarbamoyl adenosine modification protein (Sua5/YciO/YrdC/YwlC family)